MPKISWEMWLGFDETKEFLRLLENEKQEALKHISGCDSLKAYAEADGIYQGICRTFDLVEELKSMKEEE